ncbi:MAG: hypothetical protein ACRENC_12215, partial [Gemmatimonadaceae bacterium]
MDAHQTIVTVALAAKSSAERAKKVRSEIRSETRSETRSECMRRGSALLRCTISILWPKAQRTPYS